MCLAVVVEVRNAQGTSGRRPENGHTSWLAYWEAMAQRNACFCSVIGCTNLATLGAHVTRKIPSLLDDQRYYIVPMCDSCNHPDNTRFMKVLQNSLVGEKTLNFN